MNRAPDCLLVKGRVVELVPSGAVVELEDGHRGRVRWRQIVEFERGRGEAEHRAKTWRDAKSVIEFVIIDAAEGEPQLSRLQAVEYPWPSDSFPLDRPRLGRARVIHVNPSTAWGILANNAEVRIDLLPVYAYLKKHGISREEMEVHFEDEVEGYLCAVDITDHRTRIVVPDTNRRLPVLEMDMLARLRELESKRGIAAVIDASLQGNRASQQGEAVRQTGEPDVNDPGAGALRVFVSNRDPALIEHLAQHLEERGCVVEVADPTGFPRVLEQLVAQGWFAEVAFVDLLFPSVEAGVDTVARVDRAFPGCRLVLTSPGKDGLDRVPAGMRASALLLGIDRQFVTDKRFGIARLDGLLQPGAERYTWDTLVGGTVHEATLEPVRSQEFRFGQEEQELGEILRALMADLHVVRGAVIRMHAAKQKAEIVVQRNYCDPNKLAAPHFNLQQFVSISCLGDVLLRRSEFAPANGCGSQHALHANHFQIVGPYRAMIALPIEVPGAYRYGLFLLDPASGRSPSGSEFSNADVERARYALAHMSAALCRQSLLEQAGLRGGLLRAGLIADSVWHDLDKSLVSLAESLPKSQGRPVTLPGKTVDCLTQAILGIGRMTRQALDACKAGHGIGHFEPATVIARAVEAAVRWRDARLDGGRTGRKLVQIGAPKVLGNRGHADFRGSAVQLERAILNLLINGVEHTELFLGTRGDVSVTVEFGNTSDAVKQEIRANYPGAMPPASACIVSVADTGPGIPYHLRQAVFQPLFSTKPARPTHDGEEEPCGLGLTIAKSTVEENLGGFVYVAVAPRFVGATFRVVIPPCPLEISNERRIAG